jgi:hypothetical protein
MNQTNPRMLDIAYRLLAHEASNGRSSGIRTPVVVCVSEKLRRPISGLAGATGFRALLTRALSLARARSPVLGLVQVKPDGALDWNVESDSGLPNVETEEAGVVLIAQLLGLLSNFIGETLTLRLLHDAWPDLPVIEIDSREKTA